MPQGGVNIHRRPGGRERNKALAEKYNIEGFPTVIVLDTDGSQVSKDVGYGGEPPKDFIAKLEKLKKTS